MARDAGVTALRAIEDAHQRWTVVSEQLHQQVAAAAKRRASAPVAALRADFNAQLAVARSVTAFAHASPASGPDVEGLPGAAITQDRRRPGTPIPPWQARSRPAPRRER